MYFLITSLSMPALGFNRLGTRMLQSCGNTKTPGILNSMNCLLDIIFNFIFIFSWHGFGFGLGVMGAALGTTAAEIVTTIIMFYVLMFRTPMLSKGYGTDSDEKAGLATIKKSFVLSLPVTFENVVMFGAMITITRIVAPLGVVAVAANAFAITAESLCYMPAYGIEEAATALVGQSIGAGRGKLALSFGRISVAFGMGIMAFTGLLMFIFAPFMIGILTPDPAVRELGVTILRIICRTTVWSINRCNRSASWSRRYACFKSYEFLQSLGYSCCSFIPSCWKLRTCWCVDSDGGRALL